MPELKDMDIQAVSFVRRGANRRKFLLLKTGGGHSSTNQEEDITVQPEVMKKLQEVIKTGERDIEKIVELIKADDALKITEQEEGEIRNSVALFASLPEPEPKPKPESEPKPKPKPDSVKASDDPKPEPKPEGEMVSKAAYEALQKTVETIKRNDRRRDLMVILKTDCKFAPIDQEATADQLLDLEAVDEVAAKNYLDTLKKASAAMEKSGITKEVGSSMEGSSFDVLGGEYLAAIKKKELEIKKSDAKVKPSDIVKSVIREQGVDKYMQYRREHILRAKLNVSV